MFSYQDKVVGLQKKISSKGVKEGFEQETIVHATNAQELLAKLARPSPEQGWRLV